MNTPTIFKEYIWLVNTIRKAGKITFSEIQSKWLDTDMSEGLELARSTFNRHKDAIEDIFGIYIECDRKDDYQYYIGNSEVFNEDTVQNWMLSTLSVHNIVSESISLQNRILLEPVPSDSLLQTIIDSMKRNVMIEIRYCRYGNIEPKDYVFEPYCIKLFKQRWYVLGHFPSDPDYFRTFSFDRIQSVKPTDVKFETDPEFDAKEYYIECYGMLSGDGTEAEKVVLRAYDKERFYINDLPLHHSQNIIKEGKGYTDFEYFIRPTIDFMEHILSKESRLKVISPKWLANDIKAMHAGAVKIYK